MEKKKQVSFLCHGLILLSILILSCKKETSGDQADPCPPKSQGEMGVCHRKTTWDAAKTREALIGEWNWKYFGCLVAPNDAGCDSLEAFTVEFKNDSTLEVKENGTTIQSSTWKVVKGDADLYALEVTPSVYHLYGRILFCEDVVEFNNSYIDGCDNYFKRK